MQPKLFLLLAILLLLAALLGGNPFLGKCRPCPVVPLNTAPATPAGEAVLPVGFETKRSGSRDGHEGQNTLANLVVAPPDGTVAAKGAAKGKVLAPVCPDPLLRPLVVDVEVDASGTPIWVLEDGRRLWRNPASKEPLLVQAPPRKKKA
jgi:hypothetical protein